MGEPYHCCEESIVSPCSPLGVTRNIRTARQSIKLGAMMSILPSRYRTKALANRNACSIAQDTEDEAKVE